MLVYMHLSVCLSVSFHSMGPRFNHVVGLLCCSILDTLYCKGCSVSLGYVYRCTPKNLDYKRDLFCLSVEALESYTLGSSKKQIVTEDKELCNLESRVEIEKTIKQMEEVLRDLQKKLWEVESKLSSASRGS